MVLALKYSPYMYLYIIMVIRQYFLHMTKVIIYTFTNRAVRDLIDIGFNDLTDSIV